MANASPANHIKQKGITSFFMKKASESTPGTTPRPHNGAPRLVDSNVSKLTPVNKSLMQGSASKKARRPAKAKLPPSSAPSPEECTATAHPDIIVIVDDNSQQQPPDCSPEDVTAPESGPVVVAMSKITTQLLADSIPNGTDCDEENVVVEQEQDVTVEVETKKRARTRRTKKPSAPRARKTDSSEAIGAPTFTAIDTVKDTEEVVECLLADSIAAAVSEPASVAVEEAPVSEPTSVPVEEAAACDEPAAAGPAGGTAPVTRKRKRTPKAAAAAQTKEEAAKDEEETATEAPLPLPADISLRLDMLQTRLQGVLDVLTGAQRVAVEHSSSCKDKELTAIFSLMTSDEGGDTRRVELEQALNRYLAWALHDSPRSLSALVAEISADISALSDRLRLQQIDRPASDKLASYPAWTRLRDPLALGELLKTVAARVSYGHRSPQETSMYSVFEDTSAAALWRWEAFALPEDLEGAQCSDDPVARDSVKNMKLDFGRGGRAVKAIYKAMGELMKCARKLSRAAPSSSTSSLCVEDEVKVSGLEDKVTKALLDLHKATERKQALQKKLDAQAAALEKREKKREEQAAAREAKEEEKREKEEQRRKEKEDKAALAAAGVEGDESRKKGSAIKAPSEKQLKEQAIKEKQKNMLMSFLGKKNTSPLVSTQQTETTIDPTALRCPTPTVVAVTDRACHTRAVADGATVSTFDEDAFLRQLLSGQSLAAISDSYRNRFASRAKKGTAPRRSRRVSLTVTVSAAGDSPFTSGPTGYSEIKEVTVVGRKKLYSYADDYRPPYFGTFSKRSPVISGRRPFAKDFGQLNYDYDSEAEWEEEDPDGEDILQSDNEDEEEGNDLLYDDFFCRDDEIEFSGEDANRGDAGVVLAAKKAGGLHYKSCIAGPLFLRKDPAMREPADATLLRRYSAVVHPHLSSGAADGTSLAPPAARVLRLGTPAMLQEADLTARGPATVTAEGVAKESGGGEGARGARGFKDSMLPDLASFIHGRKDGVSKLVDGFLDLLQQQQGDAGTALMPSKLQVKKRILEIADRKRALDNSPPLPSSTVTTTVDGEEPAVAQFFGSARWVVRPEAADQLKLQLQEVEYTPAKKKARRITPVSVPASAESAVVIPTPTCTALPEVDANITVATIVSSPLTKVRAPAGTPCESLSQQPSLLKFFPQQKDGHTNTTPTKPRMNSTGGDSAKSPAYLGCWEECKSGN